MARARGQGAPFPWTALKGPLSAGERSRIERGTRALLEWQRGLQRWPKLSSAPSLPQATPFVSLYAQGRLAGCFGSMEGAPGERLARAFLRALEDARHGGVRPHERASLAASVAYPRAPRRVSPRELEEQLELGTHGVAAIVPGREPTLLLPLVALDEGLDVPGLVHALARKAGVTPAELGRSALYTFEADTVTARLGPPSASKPGRARNDAVSDGHHAAAIDAAATFLARQIDSKGRIAFGVDARARTVHDHGEFLHGRAAAVVQALAAHGGHPHEVERARRWLDGEIRTAQSGRAVAGWPEDEAGVAGTVALAVLAGLDHVSELRRMAALEPLKHNPWHAAQVATALGVRAPEALFRACVSNLAEQPWAPWTVLAAHAVGNSQIAARATDALTRSIRRAPPHVGAAGVTSVPEVALTALTVEALARSPSTRARVAVTRAVSFLRSVQLLGERIPASLDPAMAEGAFPLSATALGLRSDVTAHAVLALLAVRAART